MWSLLYPELTSTQFLLLWSNYLSVRQGATLFDSETREIKHSPTEMEGVI